MVVVILWPTIMKENIIHNCEQLNNLFYRFISLKMNVLYIYFTQKYYGRISRITGMALWKQGTPVIYQHNFTTNP